MLKNNMVGGIDLVIWASELLNLVYLVLDLEQG